ncbi:c-type cytochrome [Granulicella sibirica]|uniref:Putative cytochrome c, associated with quino(Hemo)protein alcohol dehydrogenase n=1 Tax=Granulicella sibirica TaxID=2479048 RepID=A0A4Q0T2L3_9BACT|nr:c-type cytochrome [Granulicella sibirica]RXH56258.1 putative cytochrome c, associated with quino(hemo)protein alcohol dehydrogenase [Granulicella sibirica]
MTFFRGTNLRKSFLALATPVALSAAIVAFGHAQNATPAAAARPRSTVGSQGPLPVHEVFTKASIDSGGTLFQQNCAFCHGKDAGGGESGPDLTRSKLVTSDKNGEAIGAVIKSGRVEKGMPRFTLPDTDVMNLVAFVHSQQDKAMSQTGVRKGVDVSDLQTGNVEAGKAYFNGAGTCSTCHSPTGNLAGIASKYEGLKLEEQMLYPSDAKAKVTVTTSARKTLTGQLSYIDEFTVGLTDSDGIYHSWPTDNVRYKVDAPFKAHVALFDKYTDADIHNLMAYLQTLR